VIIKIVDYIVSIEFTFQVSEVNYKLIHVKH